MPVPSTATIDLTNQDDRVQPLRYMELGINLNEWEKSTLTAEESLRYKFEITNTANPHDNHYFERWYVNIEDEDLNGVKQYCKLYQSPSSTAKDDVIGEIDTIMGNAATVSGSEAHGYDNTTTASGGYLSFAANPTGTANNENLSTPFVRWQVYNFASTAGNLDKHYGYMYIPKIKQVANPADQDPDFTKYVNATPSMYTTGNAGSGTNLNSDANDSISFYILSEVQDGASWKVRGLQEKSAQTVTYPAVDTLPLIQIPPLPKIKHVQLSATTAGATAANAVAALNADIDESGTGGLNLRMQFDQSPYLNTGEARFANQFLIHVEIMEQNVSSGAISPYSGTVTHLKPQLPAGGTDNTMLALEEEDVFVGVYRHATTSADGAMKKKTGGSIVDLGSGGALYTAVAATDSPSYYLAQADEALELFETKVQLSHSSATSFDDNYTIYSTEANAVTQTEINDGTSGSGSQKQLLAYVTLKLRTEADAYGAYRESELSAIDKAGTDAMDHFVEHSIVPVHLYVPSS